MLDLANSTGSGPAVRAGLDPLVMVVDRDRQCLLRDILTDDVLVEILADGHRLGELVEFDLAGLGQLFLDDLVTQVDALIADIDPGASDQLAHLLLALPTERALEQVAPVTDACHVPSRSSVRWTLKDPVPCDRVDVTCLSRRGREFVRHDTDTVRGGTEITTSAATQERWPPSGYRAEPLMRGEISENVLGKIHGSRATTTERRRSVPRVLRGRRRPRNDRRRRPPGITSACGTPAPRRPGRSPWPPGR